MKPFCLLLLLAVIVPASGFGQAWPDPVPVRAAAEPVVIDGVLEDQWFDRAAACDLVDYTGTTNNLIVENYLTMSRCLWDENYWYLSFVCSDDTPLATLTERDAPIYQEEMCELMIESSFDRCLYELSVSPRGTVYDARLSWNRWNRFDVDVGWNVKGLKSAVKCEPLPDSPGRCVWTVELAVPWESLPGGRPEKGGRIRANLLRYKRIARPELARKYGKTSYLSMNLFATGIKGWPQGPSSFGVFEFR